MGAGKYRACGRPLANAYTSRAPRRIQNSIGKMDRYPTAKPKDEAELPPPGPYLTKFALQSVIRTLNEAIQALELAEAEENIADIKAALILAKETLLAKIDQLEEA